MTKIEAIQVLVNFTPAYHKLLRLPRYTATLEDRSNLEIIKVLYDCDLVDDPEVLEAAQLDYDDAAMLVGYAFCEVLEVK